MPVQRAAATTTTETAHRMRQLIVDGGKNGRKLFKDVDAALTAR